MKNEEKVLTFNDLPNAVMTLIEEVKEMKKSLNTRLNSEPKKREDRHVPMSSSEVAEYLRMPIKTVYAKIRDGCIPAIKTGKAYVVYRDELDKWLETNRKNPIPKTDEEINAEILVSNRRKPTRRGMGYT